MNASYLKYLDPSYSVQRTESHKIVIHKMDLLINNPEVEIDVVAGTVKHPDIKILTKPKTSHSFKFGKFWYNVHHVIWYKAYGFIDFDYLIDHIDHDKANNSITNLRLLTRVENIHNQPFDIDFTNRVNGVYEVGHMLLGKPHVKTFKTKAAARDANTRLNQSIRRYLTKIAQVNLGNARAKAQLYSEYAAYSPSK